MSLPLILSILVPILGLVTVLGINYGITKNPPPTKLSFIDSKNKILSMKKRNFNSKFYLSGLIFLIYGYQIFLWFPWGYAFDAVGMGGFISMALFMTISGLSFFYLWKKGILNWK